MKIQITINAEELKCLIIADLINRLGDIPFDINNLTIQVKSRQNYKAEWEVADFKAEYHATT